MRCRPPSSDVAAEGLSQDLARAVRLLVVRSRREATGLFAGNYASAFRGGGLEFEESRPYVPGDDVRNIDWNATARHGETFVKRFREERNLTLLFGLDVSASMRGAGRPGAAATAAHAVALLAAAAGRAGDRTGLVSFDAQVRSAVPVARGVAHGVAVVRAAVAGARASGGATRLDAGLRAMRRATPRRAVWVLLSDFRDPRLLPAGVATPAFAEALAEPARRHDVLACVLVDPLELALPDVGPLRVADPESPGAWLVLDTGSRRASRRYLGACAERHRRLGAALRRAGADPVWLRTDRSPLYALGRLFLERSGRRRRVAA